MKYLAILLKLVVTIPCVGYLLWLTLVNREVSFDFTWNPLNDAHLTVSLPLLLFLGVICGFIWGSFILWTNTLPVQADLRTDNKTKQKKIEALERETDRLAQEKAQLQKAAQSSHMQTSNIIDVVPASPMISG